MSAHRIGDVIDARPDGSYVYMSHRGVLNLDDRAELNQAAKEDGSFMEILLQEEGGGG